MIRLLWQRFIQCVKALADTTFFEPLIVLIGVLLSFGTMVFVGTCSNHLDQVQLKAFDIAMGDPQGLLPVQVLDINVNGNKTKVVRLQGSTWCKVTTRDKGQNLLFDETVKCHRILHEED